MEVHQKKPRTDHTTFKVLILTEDNLPWSPLAVMSKDQDLSPRKRLSVKSDWHLSLDKEYQFNVFEAPIGNVSDP